LGSQGEGDLKEGGHLEKRIPDSDRSFREMAICKSWRLDEELLVR